MTTEPVPTEAPQQQQPPRPPCAIHLLNGETFSVPNIDAWDFMPHGIFASGHFGHGDDYLELDIFIPDGRVDYIELDYTKLREYITERHG